QLDSAAESEITDVQEKHWAVFPMTRLRPEQVAGAVLQAASLETNDRSSHIVARFFRSVNEKQFVERYGDMGEEEFVSGGGTLPRRLPLMMGRMVHVRPQVGLLPAAQRIVFLARDNHPAVETAYLVALSRRPPADEAAHFEARLANGGS